MNYKKITAGVLALSMTASLTACGGSSESGAGSETTTADVTTTAATEWTGDDVEVEALDETLDVDISGKVNTHRIIEIKQSESGEKIFRTKGDANEYADTAAVFEIDLVGKMILNLGSVGGSVFDVLRNPTIILIFIVLPLIFITLGEAVNLAKLIAEYKFSDQKDEDDKKSSEAKD